MMKKGLWFLLLYVFVVDLSVQYRYDNVTVDHVPMQLPEFKRDHPTPIGLLTTSAGAPVDIRSVMTMNTNTLLNTFHMDLTSHGDVEEIPERTVHARGVGAYGYFEVTHDVSKYTSADVFNGIGKKTDFFGRFSTAIQNKGGPELSREMKGLSIKFYTKEGNLDLLCLHLPIYLYRDPVNFTPFVHSFMRNPKTNIYDTTAAWDFMLHRLDILNFYLWINSDYGIPYGYRKMDIFPIHTYEITNKHGESFFAKFNFRSEQGIANLTSAEAAAIASQDPDFYTRDVYNSIANKNYPSWRLDLDIMTLEDATKVDYNPFDVTRLWKKGTYHTVTVGRLVVNRNTENQFRDTEQSAFNPANLVPGIPGPIDDLFRARRFSYRDANRHRLGAGHDNIEVNRPLYRKVYIRDGEAPVKGNMGDAPSYYPNSYNGPEPYVDLSVPKVRLNLYDRNAVDLEPLSDLYNRILQGDAPKQRLATNLARTLMTVDGKIVTQALEVLSLVSKDLGKRVTDAYHRAVAVAREAAKLDPKTRYAPLARCVESFMEGHLKSDDCSH